MNKQNDDEYKCKSDDNDSKNSGGTVVDGDCLMKMTTDYVDCFNDNMTDAYGDEFNDDCQL